MTTSNATLAGAIKTVLEQASLGLQVFRTLAPPKAKMPFCVVTEDVSWVALPDGDTDASDEMTVQEQVQVDIYQQLRTAEGTRTEVIGLEDIVCFLLRNTRLPTWVNHVYGVQILARSAGPASVGEVNVRRTIVTLQIDRLFANRT